MKDVKVAQLCWTGSTLYAVDVEGLLWFINMRTGVWERADNPQVSTDTIKPGGEEVVAK